MTNQDETDRSEVAPPPPFGQSLPPPPTALGAPGVAPYAQTKPGQHTYGAQVSTAPGTSEAPGVSSNDVGNARNQPQIIGPQIPPGHSVSSENTSAKRTIYVGNLDARVTEKMLSDIFAQAGGLRTIKVIPDKYGQHSGLGYGFVEYDDFRSAEGAISTYNGARVFDHELRVNWANQNSLSSNVTPLMGHQSGQGPGHSHLFNVFVGDLAQDIDDAMLNRAFTRFQSLGDARVMMDNTTGRSRGYGFVGFRDRQEAEQAIEIMTGEVIGDRPIRCNWASQKSGKVTLPLSPTTPGMGMMTGPAGVPSSYGMGYTPVPQPQTWTPQLGVASYDTVSRQSAEWNTTIYIGNLTPYTTQNDLLPLFQAYGYVVELRLQADRGYAFIKYDTHHNAAIAICQLASYPLHGRPMKVFWGNQRNQAENAGMGGMPGQDGAPSQGYAMGYGQAMNTAGGQYMGPASQLPGRPTVEMPHYGHPQQQQYMQHPAHAHHNPQSPQLHSLSPYQHQHQHQQQQSGELYESIYGNRGQYKG